MEDGTDVSGIWPSAREIAESDLSEWLHPMIRNPSSSAKASSLFVDLVTWFVARDCIFLASAVARRASGVRIVRFDRKDGERTLAHAVLSVSEGVDPLAGDGVDVMGRRPIRELARDLSVMGEFVPTFCEPVPEMDFAPGGERVMAALAGCLPWMRDAMPARFVVEGHDAYRASEWIASMWKGGEGSDLAWTDSLPRL